MPHHCRARRWQRPPHPSEHRASSLGKAGSHRPGRDQGFCPLRRGAAAKPQEILPPARQQFPRHLEDAKWAVQQVRRDSAWQPSHPIAARRQPAPSARWQQPNAISHGTTRAEPNASGHSNPMGGLFLLLYPPESITLLFLQTQVCKSTAVSEPGARLQPLMFAPAKIRAVPGKARPKPLYLNPSSPLCAGNGKAWAVTAFFRDQKGKRMKIIQEGLQVSPPQR